MGLSWKMQEEFFAICLVLMVKTSEEYVAKEIIIDRLNTNNELGDVIRLTAVANAHLGSKDFKCEDFNAEQPDGVNSIYQCYCTNEASTFSFFDGQWQCVENEDFREKEDCGFHFPLESEEEDPLRILTEGDETAITPKFKNCSINTTSSMYLNCGKWLPIDQMSVQNKFSLQQRLMDNNWLKVHSDNSSSFLNGRVIKLGLTCLPPTGKPCVIFKLNGSFSCPFYQKRISSSTSLTTSTSSHRTSSSSKEIQTKSTPSYKLSPTHTLALESSSYTPTPSVSLAFTTTPLLQESPSFTPTRTVHAKTTSEFPHIATISNTRLSVTASLSATTISRPQNGSTFSEATPTLSDREFSTLRGKTESSQFPTSRMTSRLFQQHSTSTIIAFNSLLSTKSIAMNQSVTFDGNQKAMVDKMSPNMSRLMLTAVIPGIMAGIFILLVSLLLCVLARRMGNLIRVGADRNEDVEGGVRSFSEEATIHESEENISVYEMVERGNPSDVNETQPSVTNPVYQKEEQIVLQGPSSDVKTPHCAEVIYAEPFGHISGTKKLSTPLAPLDDAPGYQDLRGTKLESVEYASRYSVPQPEPSQVPSQDGPDKASQNRPNTCVSGLSPSTRDTLPNTERKEKYALRDILVEDLDIETTEAHDDLFEEMCVRPSLLVEDKNITEQQECGCGRNSERPGTTKRQIETLERHPCTVNEVSTKRNKAKAGSLEKFKTFFKLTL